MLYFNEFSEEFATPCFPFQEFAELMSIWNLPEKKTFLLISKCC